ncbi:class I SAM-dependent DNA methyltransferase [Dyella tabacisoli]|uniref:site-specific DNA-methyltransferase (adenine-specific) n=1 Tax=Dyella tabacisoli TaxID=2282381 RepID=A0A369US98_9GAMM|nr:DNA methyltransferase [Dyella tabacisoli]RDD83193.1 class I SAM-dependent DNA methyltransferase [Dyella tabacisoli]
MVATTRNEIRRRLSAFAKEWQHASRENADAKLFWARFYECFGIRPESATIYEKAVAKLGGGRGFIDSFIPGKLIVEHKSRGKDLDAAFEQASEYFMALKDGERPRYIITSDFARFRLTDLRIGATHECTLKELPKRADWFAFLVEDAAGEIAEESKIDRKAAYQVSKLHQALLDVRFVGHDLEVFMTRLLFCFFADDTGIFGENAQFTRLVQRSRDDGKDLGSLLAELFQVLDTPRDERQSTLDEDLAAFEYINGNLFAEHALIPAFNYDLRQLLLESAELDWSGISPAIFGAMFQGVLEQQHPEATTRQATRRELGAHYTSERNILRVINPLCMDDLHAELHAPRRTKATLRALYDKLPTLTFFDPACGCGNFLVIAFRDLRRLEMEVIAELWGEQRGVLDVSTLCRVNVHQFYGIEIDDAAAHIARVALWITDHQMNLEAAERFGTTRPTVPLVTAPTIVCENALQTDWRMVLAPEQCCYVLGNPPFVGAKYMSDNQRADVAPIFAPLANGGLLDYVAAWYVKAAAYIAQNPDTDVAFVSTNSIAQGEQAGVLWPWLLGHGITIRFAHRTFQWSNEGKGVAAVHCVIVGFGLQQPAKRTLYVYGDGIKSEPTALLAKNINPYLADAPNVVLQRRGKPMCDVPGMLSGNQPIDDGNYLFTPEDMAAFLQREPSAQPYFRRWLGADEFLNGYERWCLWLGDVEPAILKALPHAMERVAAVRSFRKKSKRKSTLKLAETPRRFQVECMPDKDFLVIPYVSSERRNFIPIGYFNPDTLASDLLRIVPHATLYDFGLLSSTMHNAWMRTVAGRLKSDYRYSVHIVYNNFPWPQDVPEEKRVSVSQAAQAIMTARAAHPGATLANLYAPDAMPTDLHYAHHSLDKAVDAAYNYRGGRDDAARVAFLFERYKQLSSLLTAPYKPSRKRMVKPA